MARVSRPGALVSLALVTALRLGWPSGVSAAPRRPDVTPPAGVERVGVEGDAPAYVLPGDPGEQVLVYLPGRCGDPFAGVGSFPQAARRHGTTVVVSGDVACPDRPGRRRWSSAPAKIEARIETAVAAAARALGRTLATEKMTLLGYSEGALRAEQVTAAFGARYPRVLLGGDPRTPVPAHFDGVRAVATLAGARDQQKTMRDGSTALQKAGIASRFWVLPAAGHGQYGPDAERVVGEALDWLFATAL